MFTTLSKRLMLPPLAATVALTAGSRGISNIPVILKVAADYLKTLWHYAQTRVESPDGFVPPTAVPTELLRFSADRDRQMLNLQHALREAEALWWARKP